MKYILHILLLSIGILCAQSCIEDSFTTSPSDQPVFSTDTLHFGAVFTDDPTITHKFTVRNPHGKSLSISDIRVSGKDAAYFRINVDGFSGNSFSGVEVRGKDSIYVFVEATLPETADATTLFEAQVDFLTNGVTNSVIIDAEGVNVKRLRAQTLTERTRFTPERPYVIYDSLVVAEGATLEIEAGTTLCFHDKASLIVRGRLRSLGTPEAPVVLAGDRTGNVVADISFDIMSRQWGGVVFAPTSQANRLTHTIIRNTVYGVEVVGDPEAPALLPQLTLINCRLTNSGDLDLVAIHSNIRAVGCEFSEASSGLVYMQGGKGYFSHCTFANNYLFTVIGGAAVQLTHLGPGKDGLDDDSGLPYLQAEFDNCIFAGLGGILSKGDFLGYDVWFRNCLFGCGGEDDENFLFCLWDADPLYYTVRTDYLFDYRVQPESPAIGMADPSLTPSDAAVDFYGLPRGDAPDLGAYVFVMPEEEE